VGHEMIPALPRFGEARFWDTGNKSPTGRGSAFCAMESLRGKHPRCQSSSRLDFAALPESPLETAANRFGDERCSETL
jgi:hypothetical protein